MNGFELWLANLSVWQQSLIAIGTPVIGWLLYVVMSAFFSWDVEGEDQFDDSWMDRAAYFRTKERQRKGGRR